MADWVDLGIDGLSHCKEIGSGGFSTVYAATEDRFGRTVAVKVLDHLDAAGRRRFEREQLTMGLMDGHPNVVTPHSAGYTNRGHPYLVMEHMARGSLADLLEGDGPMPWNAAAELLRPIADALGHGHSQGILHRDVKPENILIGRRDTPKLADFGIASIRASTSTQMAAFSLAYSPPETFKSGVDRRDERSDLYSLASTLFTLVAGHPPFHSGDSDDSHLAYIVRIAENPVPSADNNPSHDAFLLAALAKHPDDRPRTAAQFIEALEASRRPGGFATQRPARPPPPPPGPPLRPDSTLPTEYEGNEWWEQDD